MNVVYPAAAVKWLFAADTQQPRPALCVVYGEDTLCIQAGSEGVHLIVRPAKEFAGMRDVREDGAIYPVSKAIARLRGVGKIKGITASARLVLEAIESEDVGVLRDAELSNEEGNETMRNDDFEDQDDSVGEEAPVKAKAPVKRAPPPKKKAATPVPAAVENKEPVKETTVSKTKNTKAKPAAKPAKAKATKKPAKTAKPAAKKDKGESKQDRAVAVIVAEFKTLKPADRASPPRGFRSAACDKAAKAVGWASGSACSGAYTSAYETVNA